MFTFLREKKVIVKAPFDGIIIKVEDTPDEVFANKMVGDGVCIIPESKILLSPIGGKIFYISSAKHALGIVTNEGIEFLVHLGIDSVKLKGEGFITYVKVGDVVKVGDKLMKIDWDFIKSKIPSIASPILVTNRDKIKRIEILKNDSVKTGEDLMYVILNRF